MRAASKHSIIAASAAMAQLLVGAALTTRPTQVARAVCGSATMPPRGVIRFLGLRSLLQGAVIAAAPSRQMLVAAAGIDVMHLLSLVPVIAATRYRRVATVSAAVAALTAGVEVVAARSAP